MFGGDASPPLGFYGLIICISIDLIVVSSALCLLRSPGRHFRLFFLSMTRKPQVIKIVMWRQYMKMINFFNKLITKTDYFNLIVATSSKLSFNVIHQLKSITFYFAVKMSARTKNVSMIVLCLYFSVTVVGCWQIFDGCCRIFDGCFINRYVLGL